MQRPLKMLRRAYSSAFGVLRKNLEVAVALARGSHAWPATVALIYCARAHRGKRRSRRTSQLRKVLKTKVFAKLDADRVRSALAMLPDEQRVLIETGFFGGITHEEMAKLNGIPLGTIKTRIRTGLRRLYNELQR